MGSKISDLPFSKRGLLKAFAAAALSGGFLLNAFAAPQGEPPDSRYDRIVTVARQELEKGVDERNQDDWAHGQYGKKYIKETYNTASLDASWCNYFALWCVQQANDGKPHPATQFDYSQFNAEATKQWQPTYRFIRSVQLVTVLGSENACLANEPENYTKIKPGFLITYTLCDKPALRWDKEVQEEISKHADVWPTHVGIIESVDFENRYFMVIEGNDVGEFRGKPNEHHVDRMGKVSRLRISFDDPTINSFLDPLAEIEMHPAIARRASQPDERIALNPR